MKRFRHVNAQTIEEAATILKEQGRKARILAGGTDLLGEMKDDILSGYPEIIVNIKTISGLDYINNDGENLRIGALTRLEDIVRNKLIKEKCNLLAEAARATASPHIRAMGTIGGNICQNNRCWYYWVPDNRFNCLRKGGRECYALTGDGRYHSIFGATRVNGTPCSVDCPDSVDIPSYLNKIREGNLAEAARILLNSNPFPAITGRVCPHLCEKDCNRSDFDEPVSIRSVERFVGDYTLKQSEAIYKTPQKESEKKIAIIGSGPAGLSAAYYLRQAGYDVTVFERLNEPGGLLIYGIPPYRLPKDIVRKQIEALEGMGIKFRLGYEIDKNKILVDSQIRNSKHEIRNKFKSLNSNDKNICESVLENIIRNCDAVFIACGAWKERSSGMKGEDYTISAAEFLRKSNMGVKKVPGNKIGIIGGGNVAIDAARSLLRLGAEPVIIYRRTRAEMPAMKEEVEKAEQEGININFLTLPVEASKTNGNIALKCIRMELGTIDKTGRPRPVPVEGSEFIVDFDAVMEAIGEEADTSIIPDEFFDEKGRLKINSATYSLGKNVFAGGDLVGGPSTVVAAIAAGRKAANSINQYLEGTIDKVEYGEPNVRAEKFNSAYLKKTSRAKIPEIPVAKRVKSLNIEETGALDIKSIESEANRCFNCGCVAVNSSDMAPALIALDARIITNKKVIKAENFFTAGVDKTNMLNEDEIVKEIEIPVPGADTRTKFIKFALRKAIDFPIVNCAAAIETEQGVVKSARICLNAVYNLPYRAKKAEEHITGKQIDEINAEEASDAVIREAFPLVNNQYKIQIARTLIKRAILGCRSSILNNKG